MSKINALKHGREIEFFLNIISYVMEKRFLGKLPGPGNFNFCLVFPALK
jgi:hypothetical protein